MKKAVRFSLLRAFLTGEAGGGALLMLAALLAMLAANGPAGMAHGYHALIHAQTGPVLAPALGPMTVHLWINDGAMALFFFVVGLEIKREWTGGQLADWDRRRLPVIAALAGMIVPAIVYLAVAGGVSGLARGWAIPAATDIAFAIGVLALLGRRVPVSLKLFLTTVAIVDDMGAVAVIALVYSHGINLVALGAAAALLALMALLNRRGVTALWVYLPCFAALWYAVLLSGVHATVAGVLAAMTIPMRGKDGAPGPLARLEHGLHPWSAFLIVPLFGFANAGVSLDGVGWAQLLAPLPLGIAAGLFLGKQAGIFGAVWLCAKLGIAARPAGASWVQLYGLALLCGIGFTMSLFIAALAFPADPALVEAAKLGILAGSILSGLAGFAVLSFASPSGGGPHFVAKDGA